MPPSSKRPQRTRREIINNVDIPDSSPSRPAKRRKKVEEPPEEPEPEPEPEPVLPRDRSGIDMNDDELITAIVPHLAIPEHPVQATHDHANELHEKHNKEGVQAYAKLTGKDWTFYVKRLKNNIGRPPENSNPAPPGQLGGHQLLDDQSNDGVHIDLGPSKMISRQHAEVYYDGETERWNIMVHGRNGIKIDNEPLRRTQKHELISGEVVEIGGVEMMFVLPEQDGSLKVHRRYLQRAGLLSMEVEEPKDPSLDLPSSSRGLSPGASRGQNGGSGPLAIAPAPPDYRRPGTPLSARSKGAYSARKSPAYTNGGTILLSTDDVDLSLDSNSHIKPSFSYAQMISQAIFQTEDERLTLNGIYNYIMDKYAYYRHQHGGGWQNSIRHNLSLNKSFHKIARATDEPGKGMKWCIVPEAREEMLRSCNRGGRGGHRGSSAPNSPANLSIMGRASGEGLNPDSTQKRSPFSRSPPLSSYPSGAPQYTPDRPGQLSSAREQLPGDGSPLPRHRRTNTNSYGLSDNLSGSPPALSSSYLQDDSNSLVTPAPHRVQPYLAPPSTAQRPSQHMPTSSPAPFWKYADQTPIRGAFDSSPIKGSALPPIPASSSPVPTRKVSPTRNGTPAKQEKQEAPKADEVEEEDVGFDLTKGFQSIGSYHSIPPPSTGLAAVAGAVNSRS